MTKITVDEYVLNPNRIWEAPLVYVRGKQGSHFVITLDRSGTVDFIRYNNMTGMKGRAPKDVTEEFEVYDHNSNILKIELLETWNPDSLYDALIKMVQRDETMKMDIRDNDGFCMLMRKAYYTDECNDAVLQFTGVKRKDSVVLALQSMMTMAFDRVRIQHQKRNAVMIHMPASTRAIRDIPGFGLNFSALFAALSEIGFPRDIQETAFMFIGGLFVPEKYGHTYRKDRLMYDVYDEMGV